MEIFRLFGSIFLKSDEADKTLDKVDKKASSLGDKFGKLAVTAGKFAIAIGAAAGTAAVAMGGVALKSAIDFEKQMGNVATLLDGDVKGRILELGDNVKNLAKTTGTSTALLTDGLYQVVSAFGDTADSMQILEVASKGAAAGNATVTDAVNLLSAVTKGYGDTSAEAAQKASDLSFLAVKLGQTSFPELASSMGKVIPLAGAMKVSQEELFGAMATLTGVTGGTAEVSTQLRGVLQGLMKPSEDMSVALEQMGYASGAAALESLGMNGVLTKLKESVDGNDIALAGMFGSVEAGTAVLALIGSQAENFTEKTNAMKDATGATEDAFKTQQATVSAMMDKMKTSFDVVLVTLGEKLLPIMTKMLNWVIENMPKIENEIKFALDVTEKAITKTVGAFKSVIDWVKKYQTILTALGAGLAAGAITFGLYTLAINAAAIATGIFTTVTGIATAVGTAFGVVLAFITSPIGLVVIAIGLLVAAGVLLYKNWDTVKAFAGNLWVSIKDIFGRVKDFVVGVFSVIGDKVMGFVGSVKTIGKDIVLGLWKGMSDSKQWIKDKVYGFVSGIGSTIKDFFGIASPSKLMAEYGLNIVEGLAIGIGDNAEKAIAEAQKMVEGLVKQLDSLGDATIKALKNKYEQEERLQIKSLEKQTSTLEKQTDRNIRQYDKELSAKLRLLDDGTDAELTALRNQIDSIENLTEQEERQLKEQEYQKRLSLKQKQLEEEKDTTKRLAIAEELNEMIAAKERHHLLQSRKENVNNLKQQMGAVKENAELRRQEMIKEAEAKKMHEKTMADFTLSSLRLEMDATKTHYKGLLSEENLQAEARILALAENNEELISLLETYNPKWLDAGKSFGQKLLDGLNDKRQEIRATVSQMMSMLGRVGASMQTSPSMRIDGSHANGLDYVPHDGYIAELHKGERVLTASENKAGGGITININNPHLFNERDADRLGQLIVGRLRTATGLRV